MISRPSASAALRRGDVDNFNRARYDRRHGLLDFCHGDFVDSVQIFLILLIPFAITRTFGIIVGDRRQEWAFLRY